MATSTAATTASSPNAAERGGWMDRLDYFFCDGTVTESVGGFFSANADELLAQLQRVTEVQQTQGEGHMSVELYDLYKRYAALVEGVVDRFLDGEAGGQGAKEANEAALAAAVMEEWEKDSFTYTCTAYIAAALDFNVFMQLAAESMDMESSDEEGNEVECDEGE